jgi:hypothetical protein
MESFWTPSQDYRQAHPRQVRFEYQRVKMVLKAFGLVDMIPELIAAYQRWWGDVYKRLSFEFFHKYFPTFPVILDAQSFYATSELNKRSSLASLMTAFPRTFIYERYNEVNNWYLKLSDPKRVGIHELVPEELRGRPVGMIYPWDGVKGGLILHNGAPPSIGAGFVYRELKDGVPMIYVIEHFRSWLLGLDWTPRSPLPPRDPRPQSEAARGAVIRPWLVQICGPRNAYVLFWLLRVSSQEANTYERGYCSNFQGELAVMIPSNILARELGLGPQQINRALQALVKLGFITTDKHFCGNWRGLAIRLKRKNIKAAQNQTRTFFCGEP